MLCTRSAIVTARSDSRHAASALLIARVIAQGPTHASGGVASGPRWRISEQTKAGPGPSIASTTSSTVIDAGSRVRT
jgi:hypothetical protein